MEQKPSPTRVSMGSSARERSPALREKENAPDTFCFPEEEVPGTATTARCTTPSALLPIWQQPGEAVGGDLPSPWVVTPETRGSPQRWLEASNSTQPRGAQKRAKPESSANLFCN